MTIRPILAAICLAALAACGARDDKNEPENYPTYDTTDKVDTKNDPKNEDAMHGQGDPRNNIDEH